jgi:hypothetical protein
MGISWYCASGGDHIGSVSCHRNCMRGELFFDLKLNVVKTFLKPSACVSLIIIIIIIVAVLQVAAEVVCNNHVSVFVSVR